ncbi:hypothetical protein EI613_26940 [Azospirillum sp. 412522]|nr:hypothetical protein [Azospirillum sp. 412522]MBY6265529.1 hypothetical protein [Azospirillum sp. 412522]
MTEPTRQWATPYGVLVTATMMEIDGKPEPMIDAEGTATLFGIHDPVQRRGFADALRALMETGGDMAPVVANFGGRKPSSIPIPPPRDPVYPTIPSDRTIDHGAETVSLRDITDEWVSLLTDSGCWFDRAGDFLILIERQIAGLASAPRPMVGVTMSSIVTAMLENMGEAELDRLEPAAFYALTMHDDWRAAGRAWLLPHRGTWVRDWIGERPAYRRLARLTGMVHRDVPSWLKEVR